MKWIVERRETVSAVISPDIEHGLRTRILHCDYRVSLPKKNYALFSPTNARSALELVHYGVLAVPAYFHYYYYYRDDY